MEGFERWCSLPPRMVMEGSAEEQEVLAILNQLTPLLSKKAGKLFRKLFSTLKIMEFYSSESSSDSSSSSELDEVFQMEAAENGNRKREREETPAHSPEPFTKMLRAADSDASVVPPPLVSDASVVPPPLVSTPVPTTSTPAPRRVNFQDQQPSGQGFQVPRKSARIPPIFINSRIKHQELIDWINPLVGAHGYSLNCKADTNKVILQCKTIENFRVVQDVLESKGVEFHTNMVKSEIPMKQVIKGLHHSISESEIKAELISMGMEIIQVKRMFRKDKSPMNMVLVQLPKIEKNKKLRCIEFLFNYRVKVENLRKNQRPTQCYNCLGFFHSALTCKNKPACVKCGGAHRAANCFGKNIGDQVKCKNCGGKHPANYIGCPKNPINLKPANAQNNKRNVAPTPSNRPNLPPPPKMVKSYSAALKAPPPSSAKAGSTASEPFAAIVKQLSALSNQVVALSATVMKLQGHNGNK